jgi:hypothetical protein
MANEVSQNDITDPVISIGVLAERVGLSVSAVRKYENEGLAIAHRTASGHRLFSHEDIRRVKNIHRMTHEIGLNFEAIRRIQALLPCWDLLPCDPKTRDSCPAFTDATRPCWMVIGAGCVARGNECRECVVYRFGSMCTEQIKSLVHDQDDSEINDAALRELSDRKRRSKKEG